MRRVAIAFAAAALSGCMVGPDYQRPHTPLPVEFADAPASGSAVAKTAGADWWTLYEDPVLNDLVTTALSENLDVVAAVAKIEEFDADLREANAALFPEFDLGATAARSRSSVTVASPAPTRVSNDLRIAVSTSFEIDFWGRLRRLLESARAQVLATHYAKDVVTLSLAGLTTQTYFSLRSLDAQITATSETLTTREEYLGVVRRRVDAGLASGLDLAQALGARSDAAAQLKELVRQRMLTEHLLGTLTGRLDLKLPPGDIASLPVPPSPPTGLPSTLLERRPDIRQAEENLVAANAEIGVAKAALLPKISLTGDFGGESAALSSLAQSGARIWSIGFALALPIFDAGRLSAEVDATTARQKQALAGYQKSIQTAFREVSDALTNVTQTAATEIDLQASVDAARDALRLSTERYEAGYSAYLDVLDAQRSLNVSQLALIRTRQALLSASVDLMKALGGGWMDESPVALRQEAPPGGREPSQN
jgi:multidrug efflux system outer membrane protein